MQLTRNDVCSVGGKVGIFNEETCLITFPDGTTTNEEPDLVLRMATELPAQVNGFDLPELMYGQTGMYVYLMQSLLTWHRFPCKPDGAFGLQTMQSLREFRKQHYLDGDTVCDTMTWKELLTE